jgi:hypothetical protein
MECCENHSFKNVAWDIRSAGTDNALYNKLKTAGIFEELRRMRNDPREIQTGSAWKSHLALAAADYVTKEPGRKLELLYVPIRKLDSREYHIHDFKITMTYKGVASEDNGQHYKFGMEIHIPGDIYALIREKYDLKQFDPDSGRQEKVHRPTWYTDIQNYVHNQIVAIRGIFWKPSRHAIGYIDYYTGTKTTRYGGTFAIDNKVRLRHFNTR